MIGPRHTRELETGARSGEVAASASQAVEIDCDSLLGQGGGVFVNGGFDDLIAFKLDIEPVAGPSLLW